MEYNALLQHYYRVKNVHTLASDAGLVALTGLLNVLGYKDNGLKWGTAVEQFIIDNPVIAEEIELTIATNLHYGHEWRDLIEAELDDEYWEERDRFEGPDGVTDKVERIDDDTLD